MGVGVGITLGVLDGRIGALADAANARVWRASLFSMTLLCVMFLKTKDRAA
jgi:hypothetical protein